MANPENTTGNLPNKVSGEYQRPLPRDFEGASNGDAPWKGEAGVYIWDKIPTLPAGIFADLSSAPPTENDGDIYIGNGDTSTVHADWDGATQYEWLRYTADTSLWYGISPTEGQNCFDTSADTWRTFDGNSWKADLSEGVSLSKKVINIGDWDMDGTAAVSVAHGLSATEWKTVRTIDVIIRNDNDDTYSPIDRGASAATGTNDGYIATINSTNINLVRTTGGNFDNTDYNSTSYNRGFITIEYTK